MNAPVKAAKATKWPKYTDKLGNVVPSVTTIIGRFKDSGALLYWANKMGREGKTLDEARQAEMTAGTLAHTLVEMSLGGDENPSVDGQASPEVVARAKNAFDAYRKWAKMTAVEIRYSEVPLVSERYKFGGRLDAVGLIGNELALCDWKAANGVYVDYTFQLAAYGLLWEEAYPDHPLTSGYHLLRFAKEEGDFSHHHFPKLEKEAISFLKMRELFDLVKDCEKRVK